MKGSQNHLVDGTYSNHPGSSDDKESTCNAGDPGLILGLGRSGEGHGNPLQYSCQENSLDREAWRATVHWITESETTERKRLSHARTLSEMPFFFLSEFGGKEC